MTNKDKYLKEGVSVEELANKIDNYSFNDDVYSYKRAFIEFMKEEVKPTLTEDERVILRNLHYEKGCYEYERIGRTRKDSEGYSDLYLIEKDLNMTNFNEYIHLFQFIKERRRIQYRGVVRK